MPTLRVALTSASRMSSAGCLSGGLIVLRSPASPPKSLVQIKASSQAAPCRFESASVLPPDCQGSAAQSANVLFCAVASLNLPEGQQQSSVTSAQELFFVFFRAVMHHDLPVPSQLTKYCLCELHEKQDVQRSIRHIAAGSYRRCRDGARRQHFCGRKRQDLRIRGHSPVANKRAQPSCSSSYEELSTDRSSLWRWRKCTAQRILLFAGRR